MPSKSKTKGSSFERELCKELSDVLGGSFTRVPNSGAAIGGLNASRKLKFSKTQNKIFKGDIICPDHLPHLVIEAKFYGEFRFHQLLESKPMSQLDEWIKQCLDCTEPGDVWVIIFKINRRGTYIFVPAGRFDAYHFAGLNHCQYVSGVGVYGYVTELGGFFAKNRDAVLQFAA